MLNLKMRLSWLAALFLCVGCASAPTEFFRSTLAKQILHPHPDHKPFLINERRVYDEKGVDHMEVVEYDIRDEKTRKDLNELTFACNVNGKLYRIALDEPGLVRESYSQRCFLKMCGPRKLLTREVKNIELDYDFLLKANARCYSLDQYPFDLGG